MEQKIYAKEMQALLQLEQEQGVQLPLSEITDTLWDKVNCGTTEFANRFVLQPMEGCDGTKEGSPDELTKARYQHFAKSGAGLVWLEAVAIVAEGRANPRQLYLTEKNVDEFKRLVDNMKETSIKEHGFEVKVIMQATHSGRYSKPNGYPEPIIAYNNPLFEKEHPIDKSRIISDDDLKRLEACYGVSARLTEKAGFDGVDIKCCHRYLNSELLSAYTRSGAYGGSFENRTRLLRNGIAQAKGATGSHFIVTSRLNVYDGFPYPYGFGVNEGNGLSPCLDEAKKLVRLLRDDYGVGLLNISIGNPYVNPHVNRPFNQGPYVPEESPLIGVERMMHCVGEIQKSVSDMVIVGSAFSYLKELSPYLAAGAVKEGICTMVGFGREAFAYPYFVRDLRAKGYLDKKQCCIACGKCTEMMRMGQVAGCVIRSPYYTELYKKAKEAAK